MLLAVIRYPQVGAQFNRLYRRNQGEEEAIRDQKQAAFTLRQYKIDTEPESVLSDLAIEI